jgi:thiamine pyrophosphokinase
MSNALNEAEGSQSPKKRNMGRNSSDRLVSLAKPYLAAEPQINLWSCVEILRGAPHPRSYAMIILNQPITRKDTFMRAWGASKLHLCADGGANRLHDLLDQEQRVE